MAIFKVTQDKSENFTLETNPSHSFSSGSAGVTGSVHVFPRRSPFEKETNRLSPFNIDDFNDENIEGILQNAISGARNPVEFSIAGAMSAYMEAVNSSSVSARKQQQQSIQQQQPMQQEQDEDLGLFGKDGLANDFVNL